MTDIAVLQGLNATQIKALRALGIESIEHFVATAQVAGPEMTRMLRVNLDELMASATTAAAPMSADLEDKLNSLPCALGAQVDDVRSAVDVVPPLALEAVSATCGLPLIEPTIPIRSQGTRGTCVAHAVVAALEYYLFKNGAYQDMSEQFLYWNCKGNDGIPNTSGTWIRVAAPLVQRDGVCPEAAWPYSAIPLPGNEGQGPCPPTAQRQALPFRVTTTALPPTSVNDYKAALANKHWIPFSIPVFNSWYLNSQVRLTGNISNPLPGEVRAGGHAMCIVGCLDLPDRPDLGGGRFILRNSWGPAWGQTCTYGAGYGTIPYIYIQRFGMEAYTVG
jgi:hypothetical protein